MVIACPQWGITLGDGGSLFSAFTKSVLAHEISHGFTKNNSSLIYKGQSGGINESFSEMGAIALKDALRQRYPFYWDGEDWTIFREISVLGEPIRYVDNPAKDKKSIQHTKDYNENMDVHYSSGVFNRAFYLLATQPCWDIQTAFDVMLKANRDYWVPDVTFNLAA